MIAVLLRRAFADLRRHWARQSMTTLVVTLSLLLVAMFALFTHNLALFVDRFGSELGIVVYLDDKTPQPEIPSMYNTLSGLKGVGSVLYLSPEEAFARLDRYLGGERDVLEAVDPQFLPPSFEISVDRAMVNLDRIRTLAEEIQAMEHVAKVQYGQEWVERLDAFSRVADRVFLIVSFLLLSTAAFVVAMTIQLSVRDRQEEIEIMGLVGATGSFIRGPFLVEAFLQGIIGALISLGFTYLVYLSIRGAISGTRLFQDIPLAFLPWYSSLAILSASVLLCIAQTYFSIQRFARP